MWSESHILPKKRAKKLALGNFWALNDKKMIFSIDSPLVIVLGYILRELAPGGAKNEVSTTYFGELLAKCRSL